MMNVLFTKKTECDDLGLVGCFCCQFLRAVIVSSNESYTHMMASLWRNKVFDVVFGCIIVSYHEVMRGDLG